MQPRWASVPLPMGLQVVGRVKVGSGHPARCMMGPQTRVLSPPLLTLTLTFSISCYWPSLSRTLGPVETES